ncbi:MAG TPA: VTT domain-containing protein [Marinobacterium sp.]|nr:VTT domain-containing protein [Marinobacterium sp.]
MESLWTLFASALISSTLLPGGSEALLIYQLQQAPSQMLLLIGVATLGNTLGSYITFAMGRLIAHYYPLRTLDKASHQRASRWIHRMGPWALLLAWLPIVGDPLCLMAGWLRLNLWLSALLILLGKAARFWVVALIAQGAFAS